MTHYVSVHEFKQIRNLGLKLLRTAYQMERGTIARAKHPASMKDILLAVSALHRKDPEALLTPSRCRDLFIPRAEAMRRMHDECGYSLNEIGRFFGGRDHTTVLNAVRKARLRAPMSEAAE